MITIVAKKTIKEGKIEEYRMAVEELIHASRAESGCISYDLYQDCNHPAIWTLIEEWEDDDAIQRHNNTEHFTTIVPKLAEFQVAATEVNVYKRIL